MSTPSRVNLARAENSFARECFQCHGVKGVGGPELHIGNPQLLLTASNGFLREASGTDAPHAHAELFG